MHPSPIIERFCTLASMTITTATPLAKALARFRDINGRDKKMSFCHR